MSSIQLSTHVSEFHMKRLSEISKARNIPKSRLLTIAIDKELQKDRPFQLELGVVSAKSNEMHQGLLINYMKDCSYHLGKDTLCLYRHDIGIEDKADILKALEDLIKSGIVETYKKPKIHGRPEEAPNYLCYRLAKSLTIEKDKEKRRKQYEKLKKEFEN